MSAYCLDDFFSAQLRGNPELCSASNRQTLAQLSEDITIRRYRRGLYFDPDAIFSD